MTPKTSEYLLLFRSANWDRGLSPEQLRETTDRFTAWFEQLKQAGKVKAGQPLQRRGKIVAGKNGRTIADGPFAESKEAIGGYFLVNAADLDEAVAMARGCPMLEFGTTVEVRPIAEICPTFERIQAQLAHALV